MSKAKFDSEFPYVLHLKRVLVHHTLQPSKINSYCYYIRETLASILFSVYLYPDGRGGIFYLEQTYWSL